MYLTINCYIVTSDPCSLFKFRETNISFLNAVRVLEIAKSSFKHFFGLEGSKWRHKSDLNCASGWIYFLNKETLFQLKHTLKFYKFT